FSPTMRAVKAASSTDVWVVGDYSLAGTVHPVFWNWNGQTWSVRTPPTLGSIRGLASIAVGQVLGVGTFTTQIDSHAIGIRVLNEQVLDVPVFNYDTARNAVRALEMTSADDGWAVGWTEGLDLHLVSTIQRWNGQHWANYLSIPGRYDPATLDGI